MPGTRLSNLLFYFFRFQRLCCKYSRYGYWKYTNWRLKFKWKPPVLFALSAGFSFQDKTLSDDMMEQEKEFALNNHKSGKGWEVLVKQKDLLVVKRERGDTGLNEYCCSGSYKDISARDFIDAQMDLDYRKKWDVHVIRLEILHEDEDSGTQIVRWVAKYPYPLYPREYIYVRRRHIDEKNQCVTIVSFSLDENVYPSSSNYVRVSNYHSVMVVKAHTSFEEKGFDYVLAYHDNPEGNIPRYAYNWIVNSGGPNFLTKVYDAAKKLESSRLSKIVEETGITKDVQQSTRAAERKLQQEHGEDAEFLAGSDGLVVNEILFRNTGKQQHSAENSSKVEKNIMLSTDYVLVTRQGHMKNETLFEDNSDAMQGIRDSEETCRHYIGSEMSSKSKLSKLPLTSAERNDVTSKVSSPTPLKIRQEFFDEEVKSGKSRINFFRRPKLSSISDLLKFAD